MKKEMLIGLMLVSVGSVYADEVIYNAKSKKANDNCNVSAKVTSVTGSDNKSYSGVLFTSNSADGDRLDVHCANVVIKMKNNASVFVVGMDEDSLKNCRFDEHGKKAGMDKEAHLVTTSKLTKEAQ